MHGLVSPGVSYICKSQCRHLLLLVLRCPEEQSTGTEHGVTPDNQVLISLTSTGQKDEITYTSLSLSQTLIENSWYFPGGALCSESVLFIFLKCHLKTFVKILWSLTLEIIRYEKSGSHASKVKMLKIKLYLWPRAWHNIAVMFEWYLCLCGNILIVILCR